MRRTVLLCLVLVGLTACASTPRINYYTLGTEVSGHSGPPVNVMVERFRTTEALARRGIMVSLSDTRVAYHGTDQWAEGLGGLVQQRLAAAFGPPVAGRRTVKLSGTVLACGEAIRPSGRYALLKLAVEIRDANQPSYKPPLLSRIYEVERPVQGEDVAPVVDELARGLDEIAARIADDLRKLPPSQ